MVEGDTSRLQWLARQIDAGWRIEAPVLERQVYRGAEGRVGAFEFVLRSADGCQVVAVGDCPEVREFLADRGIASVGL
jgi:hypothetical protein